MVHLGVVDLAPGADQRRVVGRAVDDEPRIDRDAVPAHAGAGLEDVDPRVAVGKPDNFPHVEPHCVGDDRQLVGESDVDVAIGVLDQLGHFRAAGVGSDAGAAYEALVESQRLARTARGDAADRAVVMRQFLEDPPRQHAFGAIGDRNVGRFGGQSGQLEVGTQARDQVAQRLGGPDRRGRFEDDAIALLEHAGDFGRGSHDVRSVGGVVAVLGEGRGHRDHEYVGGLDLDRGLEHAALHDAAHQPVEIGFLDMDLAAIDRFDDALRQVDPGHRTLAARDDRRGGKPDIAEPDHADLGFAVALHRYPACWFGHRA